MECISLLFRTLIFFCRKKTNIALRLFHTCFQMEGILSSPSYPQSIVKCWWTCKSFLNQQINPSASNFSWMLVSGNKRTSLVPRYTSRCITINVQRFWSHLEEVIWIRPAVFLQILSIEFNEKRTAIIWLYRPFQIHIQLDSILQFM